MPTVQVVGVGMERDISTGQWGYLKRQHPNATRATMGPMALCRRTLGGDCHWNAIFARDSPDGAFPVSIPHRGGKREERAFGLSNILLEQVKQSRKWHSGYLYHYLLVIAWGNILLGSLFLFGFPSIRIVIILLFSILWLTL